MISKYSPSSGTQNLTYCFLLVEDIEKIKYTISVTASNDVALQNC